MKYLKHINSIVTGYFTLWIILFSILTYFYPEPFKGLKTLIVPTLGIIMFGMGMTLKVEDFKKIFLRPREVSIGVAVQYIFMPLMGFILATIFSLNFMLAAGVVLVGSCPGGTASNVITYLSKGDLALSVSMTILSTLLSPILIPLMMYLYANQWIEVPVFKLFISSFQIVIIPIALGLVFSHFLGKKIKSIIQILPAVSAISIIFIVGVIVASNTQAISAVGLTTLLVIIIHNVSGLTLGFSAAKLFSMNKEQARALSIEIGMQNSGLGVALATTHFGPLAALPSALFSVWHNISGSILAWWWRKQ